MTLTCGAQAASLTLAHSSQALVGRCLLHPCPAPSHQPQPHGGRFWENWGQRELQYPPRYKSSGWQSWNSNLGPWDVSDCFPSLLQLPPRLHLHLAHQRSVTERASNLSLLGAHASRGEARPLFMGCSVPRLRAETDSGRGGELVRAKALGGRRRAGQLSSLPALLWSSHFEEGVWTS